LSCGQKTQKSIFKELKMKNKKLGLGMLVMVLVFGMMVAGCEDNTEVPPPFVSFMVRSVTWDNPIESSTTGEVQLSISATKMVRTNSGTAGESVRLEQTDLSWLTVDQINLDYSGSGTRTVTITSVTFDRLGDGFIAKLSATRTAAPSGVADTRTATVGLAIPATFENKFGEARWSTRTFSF
jgi:hypothetical protein